MSKNIKNKFRPLYWYVRRKVLNNIIVSKYLRNRLLEKTSIELFCPICRSKVKDQFRFSFEGQEVIKYFCQGCHHLFTNSLKGDIEKGFVLFNYNKENDNKKGQMHLLQLVEKYTRMNEKNKRLLLDFGIGGNYSHILELNKSRDNVEFYGCDIYPSDREYYF